MNRLPREVRSEARRTRVLLKKVAGLGRATRRRCSRWETKRAPMLAACETRFPIECDLSELRSVADCGESPKRVTSGHARARARRKSSRCVAEEGRCSRVGAHNDVDNFAHSVLASRRVDGRAPKSAM